MHQSASHLQKHEDSSPRAKRLAARHAAEVCMDEKRGRVPMMFFWMRVM